jgi:hypothetical protein
MNVISDWADAANATRNVREKAAVIFIDWLQIKLSDLKSEDQLSHTASVANSFGNA